MRQNEENQFLTILLPWQRECKQKNVFIAQLLEMSNISKFQAICSMQSKVMMFFVNFMKNDVKPTSATIVAMVMEVYTEKWFFYRTFEGDQHVQISSNLHCYIKGYDVFRKSDAKRGKPSYFEFSVTFPIPCTVEHCCNRNLFPLLQYFGSCRT